MKTLSLLFLWKLLGVLSQYTHTHTHALDEHRDGFQGICHCCSSVLLKVKRKTGIAANTQGFINVPTKICLAENPPKNRIPRKLPVIIEQEKIKCVC